MTRDAGKTPALERGSATVWMLLCVVVLCAGTGAGLALVDVAGTRQRAAAAADLAALAAAERWSAERWSAERWSAERLSAQPWAPPGMPTAAGDGAWCARANRVAAAQHARVRSCVARLDGSVDVVVAAGGGPWLRQLLGSAAPPALARARAGASTP